MLDVAQDTPSLHAPMFLQWRSGQTERTKDGALSRRAHQMSRSPSTRASNVSDASDSPPQGASPAMSYAMPPPNPYPCVSPPFNVYTSLFHPGQLHSRIE